MFMPRVGMGIIQSLKSKFTGRKQAKCKLTFRQWCKEQGREVGQETVGQLMKEFVAQVKPGKAGVRAAVAGEFAQAVKASIPPSMDSAALDEITRSSAKAGSHEAIALRSALDLEPELPEGIEAQIDRVNALLDAGRQAEGLALLKSALAQIQTTLPGAKDAPKSPTDAASASKATGTLSAPLKPSSPTHSKGAANVGGAKPISAPTAKASKPATAPKPTAAGAVQLSDKPANSSEAARKERVRRLLADAGMPLKSLEGVWWSADGEKALRSSRDILKRQFEGAKSWREREPLEALILETLAGRHEAVDLFRRFRFLSDDDANTRRILR